MPIEALDRLLHLPLSKVPLLGSREYCTRLARCNGGLQWPSTLAGLDKFNVT